MNKKVLAAVLALGIIASVGYFGNNYVLADEENPMHKTLIARIAEKFNLKEADVEAVFEAVRDERYEEMKRLREQKLSQAVADGVITESQKFALLLKMQDGFGVKGEGRARMQKWFADNGIDEVKLKEYLRPANKRDGGERMWLPR